MDSPSYQLTAVLNPRQLRPSKKNTLATSETANDSLPLIQPHPPIDKHNVIRNQLNSTRSQIMLMQAKLQNLRKIKTKFQQKREQNVTKMQFLNSVKERAHRQAEHKRQIQRQRQQSQQLLKQQVGQLRQSLITERKNAENALLDAKAQQAEAGRRRRKQEEYLLQKLKEIESEAKEKKAEKIREYHQQSASRMKSFHESRVSLAKSNYHKKVVTVVKEKEKANSTLRKMKEEQERLAAEVKNSEQTMLTSLYSLDAMNPQQKRRRFASSDRSIKYTNEVYTNQDFLS